MDGTRRTKKVVGSRSLLLDGSWFSIKQTPELNLQRAGNYRRVNYVSLKALPIIRPWEIEKSSGLGKKSLVFCLRASERKKRKSISIGRSYLLFGPGGHVGSLQSVLLIRPFLPELWKRKKKKATDWRESWLCTTVWICWAFIFSVYPQTFWPKGGICGSGCGSGWQYRLNQIKCLWPRAWPWYWVCGWKSFIEGNA